MHSEGCDFEVGQETRAARVVRALTWSGILVAALAFWMTVGWTLLSCWRP